MVFTIDSAPGDIAIFCCATFSSSEIGQVMNVACLCAIRPSSSMRAKSNRNSVDEGVIPGIRAGFIFRVYVSANMFRRVHFDRSHLIELSGGRVDQQAG